MGIMSEADGDVTGRAADTAAMTQFLTELRGLGDEPAPEPSAELAGLLGGATPLTAAGMRPSPRARRRVVLAAAAAVAVGAAGAAAAGGRLPQPAQRMVSNVVNDLTPFSIPAHRSVLPAPAVPLTPPARGPQDSTVPTVAPPTRAPVQPAPGGSEPAPNDDTSPRGYSGSPGDGSAETDSDGRGGTTDDAGTAAGTRASAPPERGGDIGDSGGGGE